MSELTLPTISSATGPSVEADVRTRRQILQEQAAVMDMPVKLPIEETSQNYGDQIKEQTPEQKIEQCKNAQKQNLSEKKAATLAKAREAKRLKQQLLKKEGNDVGDIINRLVPILDLQFEKVNRRLDDLKILIAHEGALQQNQIPTTTRKRPVESISHPETFLEQRGEIEDLPIQERYYQMADNKRQRPSDFDQAAFRRENALYNRRNAEQAKHFVYENTSTEYRALNNPAQNQGTRPGLDPRTEMDGTAQPRRFVLF